MRQYQILNWKYAIEAMEQIIAASPHKKHILRYRLEYYLHIAGKNSFGKPAASFLRGLVGFFSTIRYILVYQLLRKPVQLSNKGDIVFFISDNPSFLRTVLPVISELVRKRIPVLVLCPANHYQRLRKKIPPEVFSAVHPIENIDTHRSYFRRFISVAAATAKAVIDTCWFASRPIKRSVSASAGLLRYAASSHYYQDALTNFFNEGRKRLLAANDYWFWESLLFTTATASRAHSYVMQHGKLSDLYYPILAKQFMAWSDADKAIMVQEYGASPHEIIVAGYPYMDETYGKAMKINREFPGFKRPYIAFLTQPYAIVMPFTTAVYKTVTDWFYAIASDNEIAKKCMLKLHPFDNAENYPDKPGNVEISKEPLTNVLEKIAIVLTMDSTSMYEAALFNAVTIQCLPAGQDFFPDVSSTGMTISVHSLEELRAAIRSFTQDENYFNSRARTALSSLETSFANLGCSKDYIVNLIIS